ncbi:hypothetical protein Y032_0003g1305 [Ancylostoma ceylanicum]|uniref:Uncharacterized protein n=1 Tax=Ancylostoma ceylanicum TaxID=53326 RepID=A0A016VX58_9BILA|nr:hypothetical protein Y032_0003g1305 [Ancylostoma ceylanicum]
MHARARKERQSCSAPASRSAHQSDQVRSALVEESPIFIKETRLRTSDGPTVVFTTVGMNEISPDSIKGNRWVGCLYIAEKEPGGRRRPRMRGPSSEKSRMVKLTQNGKLSSHKAEPIRMHGGLDKKQVSGCDDDLELSMLRSIACSSSIGGDATPSRLARLHEHEYEDQSDSEQTSNGTSTWNDYDAFWKGRRARSAGFRGNTVRDMESRLAGFRHEKMKSSSSRESNDDRLNGLVYDPDFDCYYNPVTDQYYRLQPES